MPPVEKLREIIFAELCRVRQDFREARRMFKPRQVENVLHEFEIGVFAGRDIRIKNKYVG